MDKKSKIIIWLALLLLFATVLAVYGMLGKGKAVSPVAMVIQGNHYRYQGEEERKTPPFWDNYPYLVLLTQGQLLDTLMIVKNTDNVSATLGNLFKKYKIVFRCNLQQNNPHLIDTTLNIIEQFGEQVVILTDYMSGRILQRRKRYKDIENQVYFLPKKLNLKAEQANASYFFEIIDKNIVSNLFFPRAEIPEVTGKYLKLLKTRGSYK